MTCRAVRAGTARLTALLLLATMPACARSAPALSLDDPRSPLHLVRKIELPDVSGRIDHMALDSEGNHLFVAEYGNGTVDDIDLTSGKIAGRIAGLREPQGVAWLAKQREIAVACGDGTVHFYRGGDRREIAIVRLGSDADNERLDTRNGNLLVGYGSGALAVIDPSTHLAIRKLDLPAHPEAFSLIGSRVFVNLPDAHSLAGADLDTERLATIMNTGALGENYPMASNLTGTQIAVGYRSPATLAVMSTPQLATLYSIPVCKDADDIFFHASRIIVVCGEGAVQLIQEPRPHDSVRVLTERGARTGFLDAERNRLFVAVPAGRSAAAVWELAFR